MEPQTERVFVNEAGDGVLHLSNEELRHASEDELEELLVNEHSPGAPLLLAGPPKPRVLAQGDSWFAYPRRWFVFGEASNLVLQLHKLGGFDITSLANSGDEAVEMMAGESREQLVKRLANDSFNLVLFSGGGNDIVGRFTIDYLVRSKIENPGLSGAALIHSEHFGRRLAEVEHAYRDLLALIERYSRNRNVRVVTHTYDNVIPSNKGAKFLGSLITIRSWIKPFLDAPAMGVPQLEQQEIILEMLRRFKGMLNDVASGSQGRLVVVDTQNTVDPEVDWLNEIHPTPKGFEKLARKLRSAMLTALAAPPPGP